MAGSFFVIPQVAIPDVKHFVDERASHKDNEEHGGSYPLDKSVFEMTEHEHKS